MEYLLFLQNLRESMPTVINEGILFLSEFMGGTGALAVMALVYWCISKHAGSLMLLNFSGAYMMNQTLKNIFCISRPFIRDSRLQPYTIATGYSFPSGYTMLGTAVYSSAAIWQKKHKWFVAICALLILLTAFGRNWIGVHTPEDVIVGILVSLAVVFIQYRMLLWLEKSRRRRSWYLFLQFSGLQRCCFLFLTAKKPVAFSWVFILAGLLKVNGSISRSRER